MASTPFFFLGLLFLAWFTADVHSVNIDVLKGSKVVLRPVESVTSITAITWKHGDNLAVDWSGGDLFLYNIFKDTCSLNTTTGELTINNVRPEHSGVYTPDINLTTRSAMKLRVFYPVPKPSISHDCVPGKTLTCTLTCKFDRTDDLGDVEVFWSRDDRRVNGSELQITKDTKTKTFICSLKNPVSSENSTKLQNPFHPVKVIDVLEGSTVVLPPVESVTSITAITWEHGDNLAVDWNGGDPTFYNIFSDTCSLNTETGELTINNVRPEHSGVYTPDINGRTRSAMKLRVFYPVPKPSITMNCNPGETLTCTLRCMHTFTPENVGHMEVFWIRDDRHREKGTELQITEDTKTETFICSLNNPVSSENSTKLLNPFLLGVPVWKPVVITLAVVAVLALLVGWIYLKHRRYRIIIEICKTMPLTDRDLALNNADKVILRILRKGNERNLSEDSILMLLTARYVILRILKEGPEVQNSLENVKKIMEKFFKGTDDLGLSKDEYKELLDVYLMIFKILNKRKELQLSADEVEKLQEADEVILGILKEGNKRNLSADKQSRLNEKEQGSLNAASNDTSRPRDPAADPLISCSRFEVVDPV